MENSEKNAINCISKKFEETRTISNSIEILMGGETDDIELFYKDFK